MRITDGYSDCMYNSEPSLESLLPTTEFVRLILQDLGTARLDECFGMFSPVEIYGLGFATIAHDSV